VHPTDVRASVSRRGVLDRPVLVCNLVSGALWLLVLVAVGLWPLAVVGAAYVLVASLFLAAVHARGPLTPGQVAVAWATPWLAAVAVWTWIGASVGGGTSGRVLDLWFGLLIGTPCYLAWQLGALAVRRWSVMGSR
jgi:hypothetical protein